MHLLEFINSESKMFFTGYLSLLVAILGQRFLTDGPFEKFESQVDLFLQFVWIILLIVSIVCNLRGVTLHRLKIREESQSRCTK